MGARILVVDDSLFLRGVLRKILEDRGYEVVGEAADGAEAVQKYQEVKPDLVTLDITMPGMTGLEALREIKKLDAKAKVIMCSAMGQSTMVMEAIQNGASDFLVKPFQPSAVIGALKRCGV